MSGKDVYIFIFGNAMNYINDRVLDYMFDSKRDSVFSLLKNENYKDAFSNYLCTVEDCYDSYKKGKVFRPKD